jgi:hypothetical protein
VDAALQVADYIQTAHQRHLQIQQHKIGPVPLDLLESSSAVVGLAHDFYVADRFALFTQDFARASSRSSLGQMARHSYHAHVD